MATGTHSVSIAGAGDPMARLASPEEPDEPVVRGGRGARGASPWAGARDRLVELLRGREDLDELSWTSFP